jgi:hypothetical protein
MNCLDFRRRLMTDPMAEDAGLLGHEDDCQGCAAFARDLRATEIRLRNLLRDAKPPEGMAERIQLAARFERRAAAQRRWWYGAAAGVLLAIGASMVSLWTTTLERSNLGLAQAVLNHIEDEASHLREARPVTGARVKWVFRRFGATLTADIGPVHFAAECLMRHRTGVHLVMPGKMGPITVFYMPGEMSTADLPVRSERFVGRIVPTAWGSVAVVGESGEPLQGLGERLAAAVDWPAPAVTVDSGPVGRAVLAAVHIAQQQDG